jgi:phage-related minor tail protein
VIGDLSGEADEATASTETFESRMYTMQGASRDLSSQLEDTASGYTEFAQGMIRESQKTADKLTADWDRITGTISDEQTWLEVKGQFGELRAAAVTAWEEGAAGADTYRLKQLEVQATVAEYIRQVGSIEPEKVTEINALIDQGLFDEAWRLLDALAKPRTVQIQAYTSIPSNSGFRGVGTSGYRASGGPVSAGGAYVVGERGPELLQMGSTSGNVVPNNKLGGVNVTINAGLGTNPIELGRVVQDALNKYARSGGR